MNCFLKFIFDKEIYMFRRDLLSIIRTLNTVYTTIGISIFNQLDAQNLFHNKFYSMSLHVSSTYRCDDTGGCVMQFWPPDDEHMCSKHVEVWNKTYCETNFVHQVG